MSNTQVVKTTSLLRAKMGVVLTAYDNHIKLNSKSQEALYEALAEVYKFARLALETGNRTEFELIAKSRDVEVEVKTDDNPYLPVTKTLFCEQKRTAGGKVYYTPLSVAYKYAKAIRHLMENGVDEKKVARYIAEFLYTPKGTKTEMTKLAAIYKADTEAHPEENRGAAARIEEKKKTLIGTLGDDGVLGTFTIPVGTAFQSFEGFAILVGDVDDNTVSIRQMMNQKEDVTKRVFMLFAGKDGASKKAKKTMWDDPPAGEPLITAEDADTDIEEAV